MLSVSSQRTDKSSKPASFISTKTREKPQEASRTLMLIICSCSLVNTSLPDIYTYFVIIGDNGRVGATAAVATSAHPDFAFEIHT